MENLCLYTTGYISVQISWILVKKIVKVISSSSLDIGQKLGHTAQIEEIFVYTVEVTFVAQISWKLVSKVVM
jgi:hypothetical protein